MTGIQNATKDVVQAVQGISTVLTEINTPGSDISTADNQQEATTGEIADSIQVAASGSQEVSDRMTEVARATGETQAAAEQVLEKMENLSSQTTAIQEQLQRFLGEIRGKG